MDEAPLSPPIRVVIAAPFPEIVGLHERTAEYADQLDVCGAVMDANGVIDQTRVLQPEVLLLSDRFGNVGDVAARLAALAPATRLVVLRSDSAPATSTALADGSIAAGASAETLRATIVAASGRPVGGTATAEAPDGAPRSWPPPWLRVVSDEEDVADAGRHVTDGIEAARHPEPVGRPHAGEGVEPTWNLRPLADETTPAVPEPPAATVTEGLDERHDASPPPADAVIVSDPVPATPAPAPDPEPATEPIPPQQPRRTRQPGRSRAETIVVFSGKGGVGKSVIATNLAVALCRRGFAVAVVDLNLQYGDVGVLLHLEAHATSIEALAQQGEQVDAEFLDEVLATGPEQVRALLAPTSPEFADLVTAPSLRAILRELGRNYDYIVVDTASHLEELVLEVLEVADQILMVTSFSITAVKDSKVTLKLLQSLGIERERIAVLLNQTRAKVSFPRADVEKSLRFTMLAHLPYDARIDDTIDTGKPMVMSEPKSDFARQIGSIVDYLAPDQPARGSAVPDKSPRRRFGLSR